MCETWKYKPWQIISNIFLIKFKNKFDESIKHFSNISFQTIFLQITILFLTIKIYLKQYSTSHKSNKFLHLILKQYYYQNIFKTILFHIILIIFKSINTKHYYIQHLFKTIFYFTLINNISFINWLARSINNFMTLPTHVSSVIVFCFYFLTYLFIFFFF